MSIGQCRFGKLVSGLVLCLVLPSSSHAKDRVELRRGGGNSTVSISGTIVDYTGREIHIQRTPLQEPRDYPAADVIEIQYTKNADHAAAIELLQENLLEQAVRQLNSALEQEARTWVRREILALLVQSEVRLGHYGIAAAKFLTIVQSDPDSFHFRHIPLIWTAHDLTVDEQNSARLWMESESQTTRLIGASYLLNDQSHSEQAAETVRGLAVVVDPQVRGLAQGQKWRLAVGKRKVSPLDIAHWKKQLGEMPAELRAGPYYIIGRAHFVRSEYEKAAQSLLWLPLVYENNRILAARACLEAADALDRIGRHDQAIVLYHEVAHRFSETPYADEARQLISPQKDVGKP